MATVCTSGCVYVNSVYVYVCTSASVCIPKAPWVVATYGCLWSSAAACLGLPPPAAGLWKGLTPWFSSS